MPEREDEPLKIDWWEQVESTKERVARQGLLYVIEVVEWGESGDAAVRLRWGATVWWWLVSIRCPPKSLTDDKRRALIDIVRLRYGL